jgi:hypothetical protein
MYRVPDKLRTYCTELAVIFFCKTSLIMEFRNVRLYLKQGKAIPATGCGGPQGCETLRLPYFLYNWPTDGGEVVSLTRLTPRKIPGTHFC